MLDIVIIFVVVIFATTAKLWHADHNPYWVQVHMFIIIMINTYTFSKQWSCGIVAKKSNKLEPTTNVQMCDNDHTVGIMVDSRDDQQK